MTEPNHNMQIETIQEMLRRDLRRVSPVPSLATTLFVVSGISAAAATAYWFRMGIEGWRHLSDLQRLAAVAYAIVTLALVCCSLYWSIKPGSLRRFSPGISLVALLGGFLLFSVGLTPFQPDAEFVEHGWPCFLAGLVVFAATSLATMTIVRRGFAPNSYLTGTLVGGIGAVTSIVALQFACPNQEMSHLLVWHGAVALVSMFAGYFAGARLITKLQSA